MLRLININREIYSPKIQTAALLGEHQIQHDNITICLVVCLYIPTINMDLSEVFEMSRTVPVWHPMPRFGFFQRLRLRLMALLLLYMKGATADVWLLTPQPGTNSGDIADKLNECRTLAPNNTTNLFTRVKPRRSIVYCILALARQQTYSIISCNAFI